MNIGVFGGTFDPPHLGHMQAAAAAIPLLGLDKLIFVPAKIPPHKQLPHNSAPHRHRLEMLTLMVDGMGLGDMVEISSLELEREGKSYTVDTLLALKEDYPNHQLWLLMGGDMFLTLQSWHRAPEICALAGVCGFARSCTEGERSLEQQAHYLRESLRATVVTLELPQIVDISSSEIRQMLAENRQQATQVLWPQVYGYILRYGLYGQPIALWQMPDDQLRAVSYSMMRAKRIAHVQGTEEEAVRLAKRWGADVTHARRGAILHDCTKYYSLEQQLAICSQYEIPLDAVEAKSEKLLHAKTAAALARHVFGEAEEECAAIHSHTTGKGNMTLLEKILYIADYMEPNRVFPGVEQLRRLAYEDLDRAVLLGCETSVGEMVEKGSQVHPNTMEAIDGLKGNRT